MACEIETLEKPEGCFVEQNARGYLKGCVYKNELEYLNITQTGTHTIQGFGDTYQYMYCTGEKCNDEDTLATMIRTTVSANNEKKTTAFIDAPDVPGNGDFTDGDTDLPPFEEESTPTGSSTNKQESQLDSIILI